MPSLASAQQILPYKVRKLSFNGLSTSVRGDIRTVGMGGATVGLADTFIAAIDNPAGLGMTVGVGDIHYATNSIRDAQSQSFNNAADTFSVGLALGLYPWAVSLGYLSRYREDAQYGLSPFVSQPVQASVATRELIASASRLFFRSRLSLGIAVIFGQAIRELNASSLNVQRSFSSYTGGVSVGVTVQLPKRLLLGASFSSPLRYGAASTVEQETLPVPGFFQPVETPWRVSMGLGFVPNRFFRADVTLHLFTATPFTALVRDERALVGGSVTLHPRVGFAYVFADFKEFKSTLFAGTYFESSRVAGTGNRMHGTAGIEARVWIFTFGGGFDFADDYRNYLFSIGLDVFGIMARLKVIPKFWTPPAERLFPHPFRFTDDGLARPLVANWKPSARDVDPIKAALNIPGKLGQGVRNAKTELEKIGKDVKDGIEASNETTEQREQKEQQEAMIERARLAAEVKQLQDEKAAAKSAEEAKQRAKRRNQRLRQRPRRGEMPNSR